MNKKLLGIFVCLLFCRHLLHAQTCSVNIAGATCIGDSLTANFTGNKLVRLIWKQGNDKVYRSDTISSPASHSIVAGNHGQGSAANQFYIFDTTQGASGPGGHITVDGSLNIYVVDILNNRVQKWEPGADKGTTVAGGHGAGNAANQLNSPNGVFVDNQGNVYVSETANSRVQKWARGATSGITVAGGHGAGGAANQFLYPQGVYVDNDQNLYVADVLNYRIQKWLPGADSGITVAGGNGKGRSPSQFMYPIDVTLDGAGNMYITDAGNGSPGGGRVVKWVPGADTGTTIIGQYGIGANANQIGYLAGIALDSAGSIYVADNGVQSNADPVGRVQKWLPGTQTGSTVAGGVNGGWDVLATVQSVAINRKGRLFVMDGHDNPRVQKYTLTNGVVDNKFLPQSPGSYTVLALFKNGCAATSSIKQMYDIPSDLDIQPMSPGGQANLCGGRTDTFVIRNTDSISTYAWTLPNNVSIVRDRNESVIVNILPAFRKGYISAHGTNICGTGMPDSLKIISQPQRPDTIAGPKRVAANETNIAYSVTDRGFVYHWKVPTSATIVSGQGTANIVVNWGPSKGTISVNASNDCGTSFNKTQAILIRAAGELIVSDL